MIYLKLKPSQIILQFPDKKKKSEQTNAKNERRIQCHECDGFGHIQFECENTLKRQGKSYATTWIEDESDKEDQDEKDKDAKEVAFCGISWLEPAHNNSMFTQPKCEEDPYREYISFTSVVNLVDQQREEDDEEIDEDELKRLTELCIISVMRWIS